MINKRYNFALLTQQGNQLQYVYRNERTRIMYSNEISNNGNGINNGTATTTNANAIAELLSKLFKTPPPLHALYFEWLLCDKYCSSSLVLILFYIVTFLFILNNIELYYIL